MRELREHFDSGPAVRAGLRVSLASIAWTVSSGGAEIALGLRNDSLVLIAFGGLSAMDAAGSSALVAHFRHALRHEDPSERREKIALTIITIGMASLGAATVAESCVRIVEQSQSRSDLGAIALASTSLVILGLLAILKRRISVRIPSLALRSDGWLSAIGATLAFVTLGSTALNAAVHWWWIDPIGSLLVGTGAVVLSNSLHRQSGTGRNAQRNG